MFQKLTFLLLVLLSSARADEPDPIILQGKISGVFTGKVYQVNDSIVVDDGSTLTFPSGTVIRFNTDAKCIVDGTLICKGSPTEPIVFTSGNDVNTSAKKPSAGDWKGIFVRGPWADILFDYVKVAYSDSGVVVKAPRDKLNIRATIFKENGGRNLSVNKKYIHIEENYPFTFESLDSAGFVELSSKAPLSSTVQPRGTTHNKLRVGSTITGCTGVIFLAGGIVASMHFKDKYDSAVSTAESDKYRNRIVFSNITALSGGVLALLGGVGFVVSF